MDFRDTPAEAAFRAELRDWLAANVPEELKGHSVGWPDERFAIFKDFQKRAAADRWYCVHWPEEYGGRGATLIETAIYNEEVGRAGLPHLPSLIGTHIVGPTIVQLGTDEQKERYLSKILSGEEIWCQGFSEPNAGSDLAGLQTKAVDAGDHYIVNGQKVWTSFAQYARWCLLLARTSTGPKKHDGMTALLVDMESPGVEVRPLVQITGDPEFNEIFFTDVKVPKENVLGFEGQGWYVGIATLMHERTNIGTGFQVLMETVMDNVVALAQKTEYGDGSAWENPLIRDDIARSIVNTRVLRFLIYRTLTDVMRTGVPGPAGSVAKLVWSETTQRATATATELLGPAGLLTRKDANAADGGIWEYAFLRSLGHTIEAGTSEILRNILAERILGLPKDPGR